MPELPDLTVYREALDARVRGQVLHTTKLRNAFLLRTAEPPLRATEGKTVVGVRLQGKRIVLALSGDLFLVTVTSSSSCT